MSQSTNQPQMQAAARKHITREGLHLVLVANARLPGVRAQSIQVTQAAAAFQGLGVETTLLYAARRDTPAASSEDILESLKTRPGEVYNMGGGRHSNCSILEAIETILPNINKFILDPAAGGGVLPLLNLNEGDNFLSRISAQPPQEPQEETTEGTAQ